MSKYAHLFFMFTGAKVIKIQRGKNSCQENEYLIACVNVYFSRKLDKGLTLVILKSMWVSQNELEMLHIVPSVLLWVGVPLHSFGNSYPRRSRTTQSVTAWNLIVQQRDASGKFSQSKTTNPKSWKLWRLFFIRNKCWFFFFCLHPN